MSAYLIGAVYKDTRRLHPVPWISLVQAAGPDGQAVMRRLIWLSVALALVIGYPLLFSDAFPATARRTGAALCIAASAWNIVWRPMPGRCRSATRCSSVRRLCRDGRLRSFRAVAAGRHSAASCFSVAVASGGRGTDAAAVGSLFQHARRSRLPLLARLIVTKHPNISAPTRGLERPNRAAQRIRFLLHLGAAVLLSVPRDAPHHARHHLVDDQQPDGIYLRAIRDSERAARSLCARRAAPSSMPSCSAPG